MASFFEDIHQTIGELCSQQGAPFHSWGKTGELDKLAILLVEQIDGPVSALTRTQRLQALLHYLGGKRAIIDVGMFDSIENGKVRADAMAWTLTNSLTRYDQNQFGLCGRFHRVFMATYYETTAEGGVQSEKAILQLWMNQLSNNLRVYFNFAIPPFAAELTSYRINSDPTQVNDGSAINISVGDRLRMYSAGISFNSQIWQLDSTNLPGEVVDELEIASAAAGDEGVYTNTFTNENGTTSGPAFNVVVT